MQSLRPRLRPRRSWSPSSPSSHSTRSSSTASSSSGTSSSHSGVDPTTLIKRQFLLQGMPRLLQIYTFNPSII